MLLYNLYVFPILILTHCLVVFFAGEAPVRRIERIEDDDGSLNFSLQDCDLEEQAEDLRKANHLSGQTTPEDETTSKEARHS